MSADPARPRGHRAREADQVRGRLPRPRRRPARRGAAPGSRRRGSRRAPGCPRRRPRRRSWFPGTTRRRSRPRSPSTRSPRSSPSRSPRTWASFRPPTASSPNCAALADEHGALLVLDEVISGFRVARGGAQELHGVDADLTIMGKVLGGGLPAAAYGGRRELMSGSRRPATSTRRGPSRETRSPSRRGSRPSRSSTPRAYDRLGVLTAHLATGLREAAASAGVRVQVAFVPGLVTPFFSAEPVARLRRRLGLRPRRLRRASAERCWTAASTRRRRSSRRGSSPSPTTRRRSTARARPRPRRSRSPLRVRERAGRRPARPRGAAAGRRLGRQRQGRDPEAEPALGLLAAGGPRTAGAPGEYALVRRGRARGLPAALRRRLPRGSCVARTRTSRCWPATTSTPRARAPRDARRSRGRGGAFRPDQPRRPDP